MSFEFKDFISEGQRRRNKRGGNPEPFEIKLPDGDLIKVEFPDANTYLALSEAGENAPLQQLKALFRKNPRGYNKIIDELEGAPVETITSMLDAMWEHWDEDINQAPGKSKE